MAIYIEHWEVEDTPHGNRIDFAYSDEQKEQGVVGFMRHEFFEENGVGALVRLLRVDRIEDTKEIKLEKRSMNEMISHFNRTVSEMDMPMPDKMTLLGIVTAIYQRYCEDTQQLDMETIKEGIEKQ